MSYLSSVVMTALMTSKSLVLISFNPNSSFSSYERVKSFMDKLTSSSGGKKDPIYISTANKTVTLIHPCIDTSIHLWGYTTTHRHYRHYLMVRRWNYFQEDLLTSEWMETSFHSQDLPMTSRMIWTWTLNHSSVHTTQLRVSQEY